MAESSGSISWDLAKKREAEMFAKAKKSSKKDKPSPPPEPPKEPGTEPEP